MDWHRLEFPRRIVAMIVNESGDRLHRACTFDVQSDTCYGYGEHRLYSLAEAVAILITLHLQDLGITLKRRTEFVEQIVRKDQTPNDIRFALAQRPVDDDEVSIQIVRDSTDIKLRERCSVLIDVAALVERVVVRHRMLRELGTL